MRVDGCYPTSPPFPPCNAPTATRDRHPPSLPNATHDPHPAPPQVIFKNLRHPSRPHITRDDFEGVLPKEMVEEAFQMLNPVNNKCIIFERCEVRGWSTIFNNAG